MFKSFLFAAICCQFSFGQDIIFGTNNYIEYQKGNLPIVISVPHGGDLEPSNIPNRTCNNPVYATDANTIDVALQIKQALFEATGCYPHLIICHLKRNKLDCNRNLANGACGNSEAMTAWNEFQQFITTAQNHANGDFQNNIFFVDLHGHGNPIQRIELGYLLYDNELELPDETLNTTTYLNFSSIKNLALNNINNYSHAQMLRGPKAFGTILGNQGCPSVPSQQILFPGTNSNYFSGGYITANHTCYAPDNQTNGVQMELNFSGIRDTSANRLLFAQKFTTSILDYLDTHFKVDLSNCSLLSNDDFSITNLSIYPNPIFEEQQFFLHGYALNNADYEIYNIEGKKLDYGKIDNQIINFSANLSYGVYILKVSDTNGNKTFKIKKMNK